MLGRARSRDKAAKPRAGAPRIGCRPDGSVVGNALNSMQHGVKRIHRRGQADVGGAGRFSTAERIPCRVKHIGQTGLGGRWQAAADRDRDVLE